MILSLLAAALIAAPGQSAPAAPSPGKGLEPAAVRQWLVDHGGQAGPLADSGNRSFAVADRGLNWVVAFPGCTTVRCEDAQIATTISRPGLTLEAANAWNREHRFAKAFFVAPDATRPDPAITLQFDLLIDPEQGPDQLGVAINVWLELVVGFARANGVASAS